MIRGDSDFVPEIVEIWIKLWSINNTSVENESNLDFHITPRYVVCETNCQLTCLVYWSHVIVVRWCPATLISHHFTPTKDAGTGKAKSAAYWLVHGSLCVRFVMNA